MIVSCSGLGYTGSGAVLDYLSEFETLSVLDNLEFGWVNDVDGLIDLETHLMYPHSRAGESINAIERFKKMCEKSEFHYCSACGIDRDVFRSAVSEFIESVTSVKWYWFRMKDFGFISRLKNKFNYKFVYRYEKKNHKRWNGFPCEEVSFSVKPENFYSSAQKMMRKLVEGLGGDYSKTIVLDQAFSASYPERSFPFYDDPHAIVVNKDPRDMYVFSKEVMLAKPHMMPNDTVEDFVKFYKASRENYTEMRKNDRVLLINFEDLVYKYDETTERINKFLNISGNNHPKTKFNPAKSIANTQLYSRYPEYKDDIKYIEDNLSEFLYDFANCPKPDEKLGMF